MYLDFYQLQKAPFHITPDPAFLFLSPSHKAALGSIIYGIEERQGFVAITGEVGLGKTTILRSYLERIDQSRLKTIYIFNANISFRSLLKTIFREFGLEFEADDLFEMVNRLHQVLIEEYKQGRNVALIIDEAQNMPIETLENLRMLSNLETATEKLVQIVLIGQPEFEHRLNLNELRQLKQRLVIRSIIAALTAEESLAYVEHRLAKVALAEAPIFTKGALKLIIDKANGTPRTLNILCTNALIAGFGYQQKPIKAGTVKEVLTDFEGKKSPPRLRRGFVWSTTAIVCVGIFWISPYRSAILSRIDQGNYPYIAINKMYGVSSKSAAYQEKTHKGSVQQPKVPIESSYSENHVKYPNDLREEKHDEQQDKTINTPKDIAQNNSQSEKEQHNSKLSQKSLAVPDAKKVEWPLIHVLNKGDYISKLAVAIYGIANDEILESIKKHNPQMKDINKVEAGEKVLFPYIPPRNNG
jgi:general secretion pathway protein A